MNELIQEFECKLSIYFIKKIASSRGFFVAKILNVIIQPLEDFWGNIIFLKIHSTANNGIEFSYQWWLFQSLIGFNYSANFWYDCFIIFVWRFNQQFVFIPLDVTAEKIQTFGNVSDYSFILCQFQSAFF